MDSVDTRNGTAILYRPEPDYDDDEHWNAFFHWIFLRGNTFLYIDELLAVTRSAVGFPKYLRSIYVMGGELNIGVLAGSQRPHNVPLFVMTESFRFWKFFLLHEADNERMSQYMGKTVLRQHRNTHSFFFKDITQHAVPAREYVLTDTENLEVSRDDNGQHLQRRS